MVAASVNTALLTDLHDLGGCHRTDEGKGADRQTEFQVATSVEVAIPHHTAMFVYRLAQLTGSNHPHQILNNNKIVQEAAVAFFSQIQEVMRTFEHPHFTPGRNVKKELLEGTYEELVQDPLLRGYLVTAKDFLRGLFSYASNIEQENIVASSDALNSAA